MPETPDHRSLSAAAEQAAAAGDYASAERLLRELADLQEASLGSTHPDLANTLNNLGIVSEMRDQPQDAERFFRRACAIAAASLAPDHPFVATSRKNLEDFCRARGKPVELPPVAPAPTPPAAVARPAPPAAAARPAPSAAAARTAPTQRKKPVTNPSKPAPERKNEAASPVASSGWPRPLALAILGAIALVVTFIATPLFRSQDPVEPAPAAVPAAAPEPPPAAPPPAPVDVRTQPPPVQKPVARTVVGPAPVLVAAELCRDLSTDGDWECVPPRAPVGAGPLFFYTRLKSPVDTTVQHRWYKGDRLRQVVELRVRANTTGGYRTYSRNTVTDFEQSEWRVELRTSDGTLLKETRFTVR